MSINTFSTIDETAAWRRFDGHCYQGQPLDDVLLAGGLAADNCVGRRRKSAVPVSIFNSGVESQPGIKDARLLASVFRHCAHIKEKLYDNTSQPLLW